MKKVILWLLIVFFGILILSSLIGGSYEGFQEGAPPVSQAGTGVNKISDGAPAPASVAKPSEPAKPSSKPGAPSAAASSTQGGPVKN